MTSSPRCSTICPGAVVTLDPLTDDARKDRLEQIADHYDARAGALERKAFGAPPYHPVPVDSMFLSETEWQNALSERQVIAFDTFEHPERDGANIVSFGGRQGRTFSVERQTEGANVFDAVVAHAKRLIGEHRIVIVGCWSVGARERLATLLGRAWRWRHGAGREFRRCRGRAARRHVGRRAAAGARLRGAGHRRHRRAGHSRRPARAQVPRQEGQRRADRGGEPHGRRSRGPCRPRHWPLRRPVHHRGRGRAA